ALRLTWSTRMSRLVSLIILAALVIIFAVVFFQVMIGFFLPMFVAVLLAIIFRPVHHAIMRYSRGYDRPAAALPTVAILLIVVVPLLLITIRAGTDAVGLLSDVNGVRIDESQFDKYVEKANEWSPIPLDAAAIRTGTITKIREILEGVALATPGVISRLLL